MTTRELPTSRLGMASLIGALEALELHCRWLTINYPDMEHLDGIRNYLSSIDKLEAAGHFMNCVSDKREQAMSQHPSGKGSHLTNLVDSPTTHPTAATTPALQEPSGGGER